MGPARRETSTDPRVMKTMRALHWFHSAGLAALVGGVLLLPGAARAGAPVTIEFGLSGSNYSYTVTNGLGVPIGDFVIFFPTVFDPTGDVMKYHLNSASTPSGWSTQLAQPSAINLGALVEWFGGNLPAGSALGGFGAAFSYVGSGTPGSQYFEVYDGNFNVLASGYTQPGQVTGVPDATSSLACLTIGLLALVGFGRRWMLTSR